LLRRRLVVRIFRGSNGVASPEIMKTETPQWVKEHFRGFSGFSQILGGEGKLLLGRRQLYKGPLRRKRKHQVLDWLVIDPGLYDTDSNKKCSVARSLTTADTMCRLSYEGIIFPETLTEMWRQAVTALLLVHPSTTQTFVLPYFDVLKNYGGAQTKHPASLVDTICYVAIFQKQNVTQLTEVELGGHRQCHACIAQVRDGKQLPLTSSVEDIVARDPKSKRVISILTGSL
jgi:hypothetical protein